jgi:hypothetical protein
MIGIYIVAEKGKKPTLSIGSDNLNIQEFANDFRILHLGF